MALPDLQAVQETDWKPLETIVSKISKEKQKFERLVMTKEELLEMFKYNKYKVGTLNTTSYLGSADRLVFSNTSSRTRSPTAPPPLSTATARSSISAVVHTYPTPAG